MRMVRRVEIWWGLLLLMGVLCACAAPPAPVELPPLPNGDGLQAAIDEALAQGAGAHDLGISAAVIVPGYAPWVGVSGSSYPGQPLTPEMLFHMGSIAKNFEAALALQQAQEGKLDLDAPLSTWLPPLPTVDPRITPRQLLNHSSGLYNVFEHPDFPWVGPDVAYARAWELEEVFARFVGEPYGAPGDVQYYSSTNYLLLTAILEQTGGLPVPQQIERGFLRPLGLESTFVSMGALPPPPALIAHPWIDIDGDGRLEDLSGTPQTWMATSTHPVLYATPLDMARWMMFLYGEGRVLPPEGLQEMLAVPQTAVPDPGGGKYGLGVIDFSEILGMLAIGHGGSALGYAAGALYLPEQQIALAWAINTGESPPGLAEGLMNGVWEGVRGQLVVNRER